MVSRCPCIDILLYPHQEENVYLCVCVRPCMSVCMCMCVCVCVCDMCTHMCIN